MHLCILSFHITRIMCIAHVIKHLWKMSLEGIHQFLIGGRVYNALAPLPQAIIAFLLVFWMLQAHVREKPMRASQRQSISSPLPWPRYTTRSHESRGKTWRKAQSQGNSFRRACTRAGRCTPGLYWALQHPFNTSTTLTCPLRVSLSLQKPTPSHGPLTSSLQVTSSSTHSVLCCMTIARRPLEGWDHLVACPQWSLQKYGRERTEWKTTAKQFKDQPSLIALPEAAGVSGVPHRLPLCHQICVSCQLLIPQQRQLLTLAARQGHWTGLVHLGSTGQAATVGSGLDHEWTAPEEKGAYRQLSATWLLSPDSGSV